MAPLRTENAAELVAEASAEDGSSRDHLRRRMSIDSVDLANVTDLDLKNNFKIESSREMLSSSLKELSSRVERLTKDLNDLCNDHDKPATGTLLASQGSLSSHLQTMMEECHLLIGIIGTKDHGATATTSMITPWRASLAQLRTLSYLDIIQNAMSCPFQKTTDAELDLLLHSLNSQNQSKCSMGKKGTDAYLRISPWTIPSLAFDIDLGISDQHHFLPTLETELPLNVEVRPILELFAEEISKSTGLVTKKAIDAFDVYIEKCSHEAGFCGNGAGLYGHASVRVRLSPVGKMKSPRPTKWGTGDTKQYVHIKEARCMQANAYPPNGTANVDLFVSRSYGSSDITVMMNFQTFTTKNSEVPEVNIELVVG